MYIKLFEEFAKEDINERKQYTILDVTVDGNPVIQFTNLTSRNKWLEQNSNDVIDDARADGTVLDSDQKRIVGSSRGPYWVVVKKAALKEDERVYPQGKGGPIEESQKTAEALIDMLSNSMENYSDHGEFVKDAIKAGFKNSEANLLKDIFNKYWDLEAKKRNDYTAKDWAEWLKKSTHGWVFVNENVYLDKKGGKIESFGRSEEIGRLDLKSKGEIMGTILVWMQPKYMFGERTYDESEWEVGASYTSYPLFNSSGSTGTGVWLSKEKYDSKEAAIKAGKEFMKGIKLS